MPSLSRRAVVKYALVTVASLTTAPFSWIWSHRSTAEPLKALLDQLTSDLIPTPVHAEAPPVCNDLLVGDRYSRFMQNPYYLSHEGRFHQPTLEATRSFQTDQAIQSTLQDRLSSNSSFVS